MKYFFFLIPNLLFAFNASFLESFLAQKGLNTNSLVVVKNSKIFYKKSNLEKKYLIWSMSKSITSLLFGIAEDKKIIRRDEKISNIFKTKHEFTLKDLLQMSSGIDWREIYDKSPFNSHVVKMLYIERKKSIKDYVLSIDRLAPPGERFNYSSGDTNLINASIASKLDSVQKKLYPWQWLFDPLNISASFEKDAYGDFIGSSYIYMNSRDLLKLGKLILNKGVYLGKRIISEAYLQFATSIAPASKKKCAKQMSYGAQIWLNRSCENRKPLRDAPADTIAFLGYKGQSIFIIPSLDMIILRLANDSFKIDLNAYLGSILKGFK